jgi:hypothetical protein
VNFGPHLQKVASRQIETSAEVLYRIQHVPRPIFGLNRFAFGMSGALLAQLRPVTTRWLLDRFGSGLKQIVQGIVDCTFGPLW